MVHVTVVMQKNVGAHKILHTEQNDVWIYDRDESTLKLYDEQLVEKRTLSLVVNLADMVLTSSQDFIVTDFDNKSVSKISPSGSVSMLCSTAPLSPKGICINSRQHIVIGQDAGVGTPPIKLVVYSSDGSTVLQEIENDEDGEPLFRSLIIQVKQNGSGDYVVAEFDSIVCVNSQGRFRWDYEVESSPAVFVFGIVCDKYDNVIIADHYNDKILLLSSEGKLVTTLLTAADGIRGPRSLSIDRHGQLWIGQEESLKVVKYLK